MFAYWRFGLSAWGLLPSGDVVVGFKVWASGSQLILDDLVWDFKFRAYVFRICLPVHAIFEDEDFQSKDRGN